MTIFDQIREDAEKGTSGPWRFKSYGWIVSDDGFDICMIHNDEQEQEDEEIANARRIARVPELERIALAAEELMDFAEGAFSEAYSLTKHIEGADRVYERRKAALAKLREASK